MIKRLDRITSLVILLIAILYTLEALQFPRGAKIVPTIFGGMAIVLIVVQLLSTRIKVFRTLSGDLKVEDARDLDIFRNRAARQRLVLIGVSLLMIPLLIAVFGLPLALPLYVAAVLLSQWQKIGVVLACTGIIAFISYVLLVRLLAWPWKGGVLWSLLG